MSTTPDTKVNDVQTTDRMEDMIRDLGQEGFRQAHTTYYDKLQTNLKMPLYLGCTTFTRLSVVLGLVNLKARFGWSDKSFTVAKKILCPMGMEYQKNSCMP